MIPFSSDEIVKRALEEDLGTGDITTESLITPEEGGEGIVIAKETFILAGLDVACRVFTMLSSQVAFSRMIRDGDAVKEGDVIMAVSGPLNALLSGERVALNFLQHLSGVATRTQKFVEAVEGTKARIVDTRKTLPGLRQLEKYAVQVGGGRNHRKNLSEGILIKENHITACKGIRAAMKKLQGRIPHTLKIEVEVRNLQEVDEALDAGVDMLLLDNMTIEEIRQAVTKVHGRVMLEVSGGVDLGNVRGIAQSGVDLISVGRLTHSAPAVDISMLLKHG
jgi:nicotinate-nucleotide pyrophosphorylase (carboxylating)